MTHLPLALTMGDPSGIGPEISLKAWATLRDELPILLVGDADHMRLVASKAGVKVVAVSDPLQAADVSRSALPVFHVPLGAPVSPGRAEPGNAAALVTFIETAANLALKGLASAIVTNPINKAVLYAGAGFAYPGHTEFLAALGRRNRSVMMLSAQDLKVVPVTIHVALSKVPTALTPQLLRETIAITHDALRSDFGIEAPRLAVAGLNPHAGEDGNMGTEEIDWISGCLDTLRNEGLNIVGPQPADTMFHASARRRYDAAICMYHDQALIPVKTLDFSGAVNITLGLPFVRTSPDHGTAFDIAGKGCADPRSLVAALRQASAIAAMRQSNDDH